MGVVSEKPVSALRPAAPAVDKVTPAAPGAIPATKPRRSRMLAWGAVIVAVLGVAGSLSWRTLLSPVTVSVARVQSNVREQVFGLGTIGARVQSNVGFKVAGVLASLGADQGDRVRVGQVLARLDARDIEAQLRVAKAGVDQARANVEKAKADVASASANVANAKAIAARRAALVKSGYATVEDTQTTDAAARVAVANLIAAQSGVTVAGAALESAQAQEAFAEATLGNYTLYAPYDALVVSRNLELGAAANPGQSVFTLVEAHSVWALGYVDERLAGRLAVDQPAEIVLRSNPLEPLPGHVARIEVQSDPVNQERLVDVAFDRVPENIHLAEQAEVRITTGVLPRAVLVQPTAVMDFRGDHSVGGEGTVWTVEDGRIERQQVRFGPALLDGRLPILDGLPPRAVVVSKPVSGLRVGRAAHVVEAPHR